MIPSLWVRNKAVQPHRLCPGGSARTCRGDDRAVQQLAPTPHETPRASTDRCGREESRPDTGLVLRTPIGDRLAWFVDNRRWSDQQVAEIFHSMSEHIRAATAMRAQF